MQNLQDIQKNDQLLFHAGINIPPSDKSGLSRPQRRKLNQKERIVGMIVGNDLKSASQLNTIDVLLEEIRELKAKLEEFEEQEMETHSKERGRRIFPVV